MESLKPKPLIPKEAFEKFNLQIHDLVKLEDKRVGTIAGTGVSIFMIVLDGNKQDYFYSGRSVFRTNGIKDKIKIIEKVTKEKHPEYFL